MVQAWCGPWVCAHGPPKPCEAGADIAPCGQQVEVRPRETTQPEHCRAGFTPRWVHTSLGAHEVPGAPCRLSSQRAGCRDVECFVGFSGKEFEMDSF